MNTFLPYADIEKSVACLDYRRLGKQRVEAWQIYLALTGEQPRGWRNHPAVLMWKGYETALLRYGLAACMEWKRRGYKDTMAERFSLLLKEKRTRYPPWWGDERVHSSHRANLLRKDEAFYRRFGWGEVPLQGYFWPVTARGVPEDQRVA